MQSQVTIRNAVLKDAENIVRFNKSMAHETEGTHLDQTLLTSGVNAVLSNPKNAFYLVAEIDSAVVGSLMVTTEWSDWRNADFWWIQSVYVEPDFRRRGVFTALYQEARLRAASAPNVCGCRLYVERENKTAQKTYSSLGFKETKYKLYEELFQTKES